MAQFDAEQRDRYWQGWERSRSEQFAIEQGGRLYPARHLVNRTITRLRNIGQRAAVAFLRALGFNVVTLPSSAGGRRPSQNPPSRAQSLRRGKRLTGAYLSQFNLTLAPMTMLPRTFRTEREFELQVIEPHLGGWGCHSAAQVTRTVYRGKKKLPGRIDFVVRHHKQGALVTIIEAKREIRSLAQLFNAAYQAESYARALRLRHFVVAAPEGCWIFTRSGRSFRQHVVFGPEVWDGRAAALRTCLYELSGLNAIRP